MPKLSEAVQDFLAQKRIAVLGVSRKGDTAANAVYQKLRAAGYEVFPVNPNADTVEGDRCYPSLSAIPGGVGAVFFGAPPQAAAQAMRDCAQLGIRRIWMHRSFIQGSVDPEAVRLGGELGLTVIPGFCPMMFVPPVDPAHGFMRWVMQATGGAPKPVG